MLNTFNIDGDKKNVCFKKKILKYFVTNGNSTIQELAKEINLSIPTITKAVGELQNMGYVNEYGKQETGEGRRPIPVSYTHLTLPTIPPRCRSRWSPYH